MTDTTPPSTYPRVRFKQHWCGHGAGEETDQLAMSIVELLIPRGIVELVPTKAIDGPPRDKMVNRQAVNRKG